MAASVAVKPLASLFGGGRAGFRENVAALAANGPFILLALALAILVAAGCGISTVYLFPWTMVPDTVEYSEWKSGATQEGFLYGFFVFGLKLAQALAGFLAGFALQASGSLRRITFTLLPAGLMALGLAFLAFYPIDAAFHARIRAELKGRRIAARRRLPTS